MIEIEGLNYYQVNDLQKVFESPKTHTYISTLVLMTSCRRTDPLGIIPHKGASTWKMYRMCGAISHKIQF